MDDLETPDLRGHGRRHLLGGALILAAIQLGKIGRGKGRASRAAGRA